MHDHPARNVSPEPPAVQERGVVAGENARMVEGYTETLHNQMHALANQVMRGESPNHTLQPSALLNEAWLRLCEQHQLDPTDRTHYLAATAQTMRRILVDHARKKKRQKRGGRDHRQLSLNSLGVDEPPDPSMAQSVDIVALDDVLDQFAEVQPRAARVVELRYFGGLEQDAIAAELQISLRTVNYDWRFAKAWLYRALSSRDAEHVS